MKWLHEKANRLGVRLSALFLVGGLAPTLVLALFLYDSVHRSMRDKEILHMQDNVSVVNNMIENTVTNIERSMTAVLQFDEVREALVHGSPLVSSEGFYVWKTVEEILQTQYPDTQTGYSFTLIGTSDIVYTNGSFLNWGEEFDGELARKIRAYEDGMLLLPRDLYTTGDPRNDTVTFGRRVVSGGEVTGVILVDIDVAEFDAIFSSFTDSQNIVCIVNSLGDVVYTNSDTALTEGIEYGALGENGTLSLGGSEYLYVRNISAPANCLIYSFLPTDSVYQDSLRIIQQGTLIVFLVLAETVLFSLFVSRLVSRPVLNLSRQVRDYSEHHTPITLTGSKQDEVGVLTQDVRDMSLRIDDMVNRVYETERAKRRLQYQALQAQINPHMIYNTLNTITSLARMQGVDNIEEVSESFTQLLHIVLKTEGDFLTLRQELEYLSCYVAIKKYNTFQEIDLRFDVPQELLGEPILKLLLQPFVENAIRHGFPRSPRPGVILVRVRRQPEGMAVSVTDNGCGMSREQAAALSTDAPPPENGHSIGVRNTVQRLALQYEGRYQFYILSSPGHYTQINIVYPLEQKGGPS